MGAAACGIPGEAWAMLGAATKRRRLDRVSALVLADRLEDCGDGRAALVRGLATAALVEVADAWRPPLPAGGAGPSCYWSAGAAISCCQPSIRALTLSVRASSPCLPAHPGTFCDHVVAEAVWQPPDLGARLRRLRLGVTAPYPIDSYRLGAYLPGHGRTSRYGFSVPNGSGLATVAAAAYERWAAAILTNLFPAQPS
jgi:hypothetical protein